MSYFGVLRDEALSADRRPVARWLENVEISAFKNGRKTFRGEAYSDCVRWGVNKCIEEMRKAGQSIWIL